MMTTLADSENSYGPLCLILCGLELPCENRFSERCDRIEIIDFHFLLDDMMDFLKKFTGPPSKDQFAKAVIAEFRRAGDPPPN